MSGRIVTREELCEVFVSTACLWHRFAELAESIPPRAAVFGHVLSLVTSPGFDKQAAIDLLETLPGDVEVLRAWYAKRRDTAEALCTNAAEMLHGIDVPRDPRELH
jgi:hypothetical protein